MQFAQNMKNCGSPLSKVEWIFFDLDNTLYSCDSIYKLGLKNSWKFFNKSNPLAYNEFLKQYSIARNQVKTVLKSAPSARNRVLYFKRMVENIIGRPVPKIILGMIQSYEKCWAHIDSKNAQWVLRQLSNRYGIGIITNQVCLTQMQKLSMIDPYSKWIDFVITSEEVGFEKPHRNIFLEACNRVGVSPNQCAIVGDDWESDVLGSLSLGFQVIFLGSPKKIISKKIYATKNIREIVNLFHDH